MNPHENILERLRTIKPALQQEFPLRRMALFGSWARSQLSGRPARRQRKDRDREPYHAKAKLIQAAAAEPYSLACSRTEISQLGSGISTARQDGG